MTGPHVYMRTGKAAIIFRLLNFKLSFVESKAALTNMEHSFMLGLGLVRLENDEPAVRDTITRKWEGKHRHA